MIIMSNYPDIVTGVCLKDNKVFVMENIKQSDPALDFKNDREKASSRLETPGGKIDGDESHEYALKREFKEEFNVEITVGKYIGSIPTTIPNGVELNVHTYYVEILGAPENQEPLKCGRFGYFSLQELNAMLCETTVLTKNLATLVVLLKESGEMT